ncbi:MAG: hypothetical protein ACJAQ3_003570 [Planctomycetota bacterium]
MVEHPNAITALYEGFREVRADESGAACDEIKGHGEGPERGF